MDWHSSVRTHYETLDNEAHNQDEHITTWYMIPWINIPRNLFSERDLFIGFCFKEILPFVFGHRTFQSIYSLSTNCQAVRTTVNILTVSNEEKVKKIPRLR